MIGQMLLVGFRGLEVSEHDVIAKNLRERNLGGVILFDKDLASGSDERNVRSPAQVKELNASLQRLAETPLFVSVDQEGGFVARLKPKHGFPATLSALKLAGLPQADLETECSRLARTLAEAGFNLNFAPDVDVNVNPESPAIGKWERSFSPDPAVVAKKAATYIDAHHHWGVLTVLKHFPGHGSSRADSHLGMTDVTETWRPYELEPFEELAKAGKADAIMTAHVFNRRLDPDHPATLSQAILTGILRERMGFDGVVFTDDMQMGAITKFYGLEKAVKLSLLAGADILTFGNNLVYDDDIMEKVVALVAGLVERGEIPAARIEQSYRRILALKARLARR